jgi:CheY-like chemotaxis protein
LIRIGVKILIAEDDRDILSQYMIALESRKHKVVTATNGEECLQLYTAEAKQSSSGKLPPFDAVVLDYRMPKMDGMEVAKKILAANPHQRIIFASAYVKETLVDSVKQLKQIVELLQKPFQLDTMIDILEDKEIFEQLERLNVKVKEIKGLNPTHEQVRDLLEGLRKLHKRKAF